jgi:hypothetical protein
MPRRSSCTSPAYARNGRISEPVCFPKTAQAPVLTSNETAAIVARVQELGGIGAMQHYRAAGNAKFTLLGFEAGLAGAWYDAEKGKPPQVIHHNIRLSVPTPAEVFSKRLSTYNSQTTRTPMPARLLTFEQIAQAVGGAAMTGGAAGGRAVAAMGGLGNGGGGAGNAGGASGSAAIGVSGSGVAAASATALSGNAAGGANATAAPSSFKWAPILSLGPTGMVAAPGAAHGAVPAAESTVRRRCVRTVPENHPPFLARWLLSPPMSVCPSAHLPICPSVHLSVC